MNKRIAVYAGTFDPITVGHLWMVEQGSLLFDRLIVAIGINPEKRCMFSVNDRLEMLRRSVEQFTNVEVSQFANQFLVNYARSVSARFVLRGIRNEGDYAYERTMRYVNGDLNPSINTVFLMPPREIAEVSSEMVRGLVGPEGWEDVVQKYVPGPVFDKLKGVRNGKTN